MFQLFNQSKVQSSDLLGVSTEVPIIEYRLYGWVPYNISPIQAGIQFGHAAVRHMRDYGNNKDVAEWAHNHETFIILNGGPMANTDTYGMGFVKSRLEIIKKIVYKFNGNIIPDISEFNEPDLWGGLSGIVFVADNRAFDRGLLTKEAKECCQRVYDKLMANTEDYLEEDLLVWNVIGKIIGFWNLCMQLELLRYDLARN